VEKRLINGQVNSPASNNDSYPSSTGGALTEVVYTPQSTRGQGWHIWRTMIGEILNSRELIWRLIVRDISVRYRQSVLGYVWAILPPVVAVAIFAFLATSRTIPISQTSLPYVVYALWSIGVWQFFAGCLSGCTNSLMNAGALVTKLNFPREALVIAAIGQPIFDFLIRLVPLISVFIWYDVSLQWQVILLPLILIPAILLALGLGFVLSVATLVIRDVSNLVSMVVTFGIFLTPALYPPPTSWPLSLINIVNPFSPVLIASQDLIAYGTLTTPLTFLLSCVLSTIIFFVGLCLFRLTLARISQHA
jgi:lipopolysaccharide transport system permease protein